MNYYQVSFSFKRNNDDDDHLAHHMALLCLTKAGLESVDAGGQANERSFFIRSEKYDEQAVLQCIEKSYERVKEQWREEGCVMLGFAVAFRSPNANPNMLGFDTIENYMDHRGDVDDYNEEDLNKRISLVIAHRAQDR